MLGFDGSLFIRNIQKVISMYLVCVRAYGPLTHAG